MNKALVATAITLLPALFAAPGRATTWKLDFGAAATEPGYTAVGTAAYSTAKGYGWVSGTIPALRDRGRPDALRRDFVYGTQPATFRVNVTPGTYKLTMVMGDTDYGNHELRPSVNVPGVTLPDLTAGTLEFATLTAAFEVSGNTLDVTCDSPVANWVLNALALEPADAPAAPVITKKRYTGNQPSTWQDVLSWPDPVAPYIARYRANLADAPPTIVPTGLTRQDYLAVITGEVDFWKQHQNASGAVIDPYKNIEWQYSTPAFALSAALLVDQAGRTDLLEPAAKAMDWAVNALATHTAPQHHEDFFAPMLAHALPLLKPRVDAARSARWEAQIRGFDPYTAYSAGIGGGNWNVVALSGDALFGLQGLRDSPDFTEDSLAAQGKSFTSRWGLYLEGPMPYDHFPRLWAADMIANGYAGEYADRLAEVLRRASLTSLLMQSPNGELPAGGRSAHHQWNEAEQCVTYEIYAAKALADGDPQLAAAFKRAAHLSLASMKRWVRPSGEMWIVKNYFDPSLRFGYEGYSAHSQYNLLPMAMLAIAYQHAQPTETVAEIPAPADAGGFVFQIDPGLHKIFANAGGMYIELDTNADSHYNATGLIRVHKTGMVPQIGPSDSLTAGKSYESPATARTTAAIGAAWKGTNGAWKRLAEFTNGAVTAATVSNVSESPNRVSFTVTYSGAFDGPASVIEDYVVTPDAVDLTTRLPGYTGPVQYVWPMLADNGAETTDISVQFGAVRCALGDGAQTFTPIDAASVSVPATRYAFHNGWARLGIAEYPNGGPVTLHIAPTTPLSLVDAARALRIAGGLETASAGGTGRLDAVPDGALDVRDALAILTSLDSE
jgi:hypothetical protein